MNPSVTVIMPVYNAQDYVAEAIQSILSQSHSDWELLVVNDGSTDDSERVIRSFDDPRIHYFKQENRGVSVARNVGLKHMRGNYFCFLDADDVLTPESLAARCTILDSQPDVCFVDGSVEVMDRELKTVIRLKEHTFIGNPINALLSLDSSCFFGPTWMIRRMPDTIYSFRESLTHGEDLLFYMTISQNGLYFPIKEVTYRYRSDNNSAMSDIDGLWSGYKTILSYLTDSGIESSQVSAFRRKIYMIMLKSFVGAGRPWKAMKLLLEFVRS